VREAVTLWSAASLSVGMLSSSRSPRQSVPIPAGPNHGPQHAQVAKKRSGVMQSSLELVFSCERSESLQQVSKTTRCAASIVVTLLTWHRLSLAAAAIWQARLGALVR
jgi:hypothetical protein